MQFYLYGVLRLSTGQKIVALELTEAIPLREALEMLFQRYPALRETLLDEAARLRPNVPIFLNGRNPRLLPEGLSVLLTAADVVSLFSPFTSGRMNVEVLREPALGQKE